MLPQFDFYASDGAGRSDTAIASPASPIPQTSFFLRSPRFNGLMVNKRLVAHPPSAGVEARPVRAKRRFDDDDEVAKKSRNSEPLPSPDVPLTIHNLADYPKFNHPDGGIIQFTPLGNVRTFTGDNNVVHTIVEKHSTFDLADPERGIDGYKIYLGNESGSDYDAASSPKRQPTCLKGVFMEITSSNEAEDYMVRGYTNPATPPASAASSFYAGQGANAAKLSYFIDDSDFDDEDDDVAMD